MLIRASGRELADRTAFLAAIDTTQQYLLCIHELSCATLPAQGATVLKRNCSVRAMLMASYLHNSLTDLPGRVTFTIALRISLR